MTIPKIPPSENPPRAPADPPGPPLPPVRAAPGDLRKTARNPRAPVAFWAEGIALRAKAFGSASPLQLAKVEVFYVGARCLTKSVHS